MPPVIPLVHDELHMSETQVGLLVGLPLALFALAAIPGSLLIARIGTRARRGHRHDRSRRLPAARAARQSTCGHFTRPSIATGFGVAIMQPGHADAGARMAARPHRARHHRLYRRHADGRAVCDGPDHSLSCCRWLAALGGSTSSLWAVPALLIAPVFLLLSPKGDDHGTFANKVGGLWWPDFKDPLVWLLGLTFGSNNSPFFGTNAFLGDYLASQGKAGLLGPALGWLNGAQIVAPIILLLLANRLQRRAWPFLLFGPVLLAAFLGLIFGHSTVVILVCAALIGFTTAITLTATLALPPLLSSPADLARTSAGMFTISYTTRNYHSDHQRRAVGRDRQTVDGVCAVVPLCGGADGPWHGGGALSACHRELSGPTIGPWYRCDRKA